MCRCLLWLWGLAPSAVVDALCSVGWCGVNVYRRLACSGGCYNALSGSPDGAVGGCCDICGLCPVVEVLLCAQAGMVVGGVSACVEGGGVLVFEGGPGVSPVLFAVSRPMWGALWCRLAGGVSCCVAAAREWCYAGSACGLV